MLRVTNTSGEPVTLRLRGTSVELMPDESYDVQGYKPDDPPPGRSPHGETLRFWPDRHPEEPRARTNHLTSARSDDKGSEPQRSSRGPK